MLPMSVRDNLTLAVLEKVARGGVIRPRREKATVAKAVERLRIKTRDAALQPVGTLSGGNQQKVLIGRWLLTQPDVLLLFDITRGVDVGTKHDIYQLVVELAAGRQGAPLLLERDRGDRPALSSRARHARGADRRGARPERGRRDRRRRLCTVGTLIAPDVTAEAAPARMQRRLHHGLRRACL